MPMTIKDVARESGVNFPTVQDKPSAGGGLYDRTREHAVTGVNYRPDHVARGLLTVRLHSSEHHVSAVGIVEWQSCQAAPAARTRALQET